MKEVLPMLFRTPRTIRRLAFLPRLLALEDRTTPSGGLLDPTFGSGGVVNLPTATDGTARAVAVQPDGKVVVAGVGSTRNGAGAISVQRLNPNGTLDTTFNRTGSVTISGSSTSMAVALQPDGKILIGGSTSVKKGKTYTTESLVARLNTNGTLDTTFGSNGLWVSASSSVVEDLAVLTDPAHPGTVTGIVGAVWGASFEAVKLTPAGVPDKTFGSGGFAVFPNLSGRSVSVAADRLSGEIYLTGYVNVPNPSANTTGALAALTPTGALDMTFGGGAGYVLADPTGPQVSQFSDVAVQTVSVNGQPVSRLVVAGQSWVQTPASGYVSGYVAAYTLGGALDTTFGIGGSFTLAGVAGGIAPGFNSLAVEADGSIVVGGGQFYGGGTGYAEMLVGHLTASGAVDTSFGPDGSGFTAVQDGTQSDVRGLAIDPTNGGILACGDSDDGGNQPHAAIIRLTAP
jgi:uncharacterized delta-60 repeat protein